MNDVNELTRPTLLRDLLDMIVDVNRAAHNAEYGSWAQRNPLAGKMQTCGSCGTRRRSGIRQVNPCCHATYTAPWIDKEGKPTGTPTLAQFVGRSRFAGFGKRKRPHRSARKLRAHELLGVLNGMEGSPATWSETAQAAAKQAQKQIISLPPFHTGAQYRHTSPATTTIGRLEQQHMPALAERIIKDFPLVRKAVMAEHHAA